MFGEQTPCVASVGGHTPISSPAFCDEQIARLSWADTGKTGSARMAATTETANELIRLTEKLLRHYGRDIDGDDLTVRCLVLSDFFITAYSVQPGLTVYRILQLDEEANISQLFAATWRCGSETPDLLLCRDGAWEETFRKLSNELIDLTP